MRTWHVHGVHRLTWVVLLLLVLAVAVFAMAAGFSRLRSRVAPEPQRPRAQAGVPPASLALESAFSDFPYLPKAL
jgi:hypothetical protein